MIMAECNDDILSSRDYTESAYTTLLYYHYTLVTNVQQTITEQISLCQSLQLNGRVRISPEGFNGTLDGLDRDIRDYIKNMEKNEQYRGIHWKLGKTTLSKRISNLSVKAAKEVVSLDLPPAINDVLKSIDTGIHVSPEEFHLMIEEAAAQTISHSLQSHNFSNPIQNSCMLSHIGNKHEEISDERSSSSSSSSNDTILLDVRNLYETRIGKFHHDGVVTVDPATRNYSEFAKYVDDNIDNLRNKKILAYCTGGVRCEKASKYLKYKGVSEVYQLSGGIHAYMEVFPEEKGLFHGKNFVYDPRIAVPYPTNNNNNNDTSNLEVEHHPSSHKLNDNNISDKRNCNIVIGKCLLCDLPYDDYSAQFRCTMCRMLVLICDVCVPTNNISRDKVMLQQLGSSQIESSYTFHCEHCIIKSITPKENRLLND